MVRAAIVDDENSAIEALKSLISQFITGIEIVTEASDINEAVTKIKEYNPDLVFLDIQMPGGSGFNVLEQLAPINFNVIFTTAFDQYAIQAIKYSALDYLLKPIVPSELIKAIEKHKMERLKVTMEANFRVLLDNLKQPKDAPQESKKIVLSTQEGMHVVSVSDILRCESDDCYTTYYLVDKKKIMVSKTLKETEDTLSDSNFIRPHKSHLINLKYVKTLIRSDGGYIMMSDGTEIPVSRRKKEYVVDLLRHLS